MNTSRKKVLFITTLLSPFQIEHLIKVNSTSNFDFHIAFTIPYSENRGGHWASFNKTHPFIHVAPKILDNASQALWAESTVDNISPNVIILGMFKGPIFNKIKTKIKTMPITLGLWLEPPNYLNSFFKQKIINTFLYKNLKGIDFILSIGDRAEKNYRKYINNDTLIYLLPYAQDLSINFKMNRKPSSKIRFLFSGQLVKRHNIPIIGQALIELQKTHSGLFIFTVAGFGDMQSIFDKIILQDPSLKDVIRYDRDYTSWEDRLNPFSENDVLVYPSSHSGWALVIPEAMAAGMTVISTKYVEACRYFIRHRVNGIVIEPTLPELVREMKWCIDNKEDVYHLGARARTDAMDGDVNTVAKSFSRILDRCL